MLDVAVIGGGPVGSRIACNMAALGYQTAVLEQRKEIGAKPCCTGIISQECANKYDVPDSVIHYRANSARIYSPFGKAIRVYRPEPQACVVDRPAFDRLLAARAQSKGVVYHLSCKVHNLVFTSDHVQVESEQQGQNQKLEARVVVLATGFSSVLVKRLGLGQPAYQTAGVQTEVKTANVSEVQVFLGNQLAPGFFAWLVPTREGWALAGMMSRQSPGRYLRQWISRLEAEGTVIPEMRQIRYAGIPLKPLSRTFGTRMLVAGDAAGQVKPTTGGGIYFGLICADIAAETLHKALQMDDFSARNLSIYEKKWRQKLGAELRREYYARRIISRLSDRQLEKMFAFLQNSGLLEALLKEKSVAFDWHGGLLLKVLRLGVLSQTQRLWRAPLKLFRR